MDPRIPATDLSPEEAAPVTSMVAAAPNATYTINEREKGAKTVEFCRAGGEGSNGRECKEIAQEVTKVFALMQKQGFFCQLPFDPTHTEIECLRINKIVARQS
ncbi:hypothetical protein JCM11251_002509 [Rhodosporidiobolus azoricus]